MRPGLALRAIVDCKAFRAQGKVRLPATMRVFNMKIGDFERTTLAVSLFGWLGGRLVRVDRHFVAQRPELGKGSRLGLTGLSLAEIVGAGFR